MRARKSSYADIGDDSKSVGRQMKENGYLVTTDHRDLGPMKVFAPPARYDGDSTGAGSSSSFSCLAACFTIARVPLSANAVAEKQPKSMKNDAKFIENPSKIDQNGAQERSESDLGSRFAISNLPGSSRKPFLASHG